MLKTPTDGMRLNKRAWARSFLRLSGRLSNPSLLTLHDSPWSTDRLVVHCCGVSRTGFIIAFLTIKLLLWRVCMVAGTRGAVNLVADG